VYVGAGLVDEAVERALERREPEPVVHELGPALVDGPLEPGEVALDRDVLELLVRRDERHGSGSLVDLAALDADEPVLDEVDASDALSAGPPVHLLHHGERVRGGGRRG
jgi:hypothetical protein